MMDSHSVITQAVPNIKALAAEMDVTEKRCYEILGKDSPYPKAKKLVRDIANTFADPIAIEKIKIDFSVFCDKLIGRCKERKVAAADVHKELSEAIQAVLEDKPTAEQEKEIREAIGILNQKLLQLGSRESTGPIRMVR